MSTILLTWNPKRWDNGKAEKYFTELLHSKAPVGLWSCGNRKNINHGDRVFILKQGDEPRGIFASGRAQSAPCTRKHYADQLKTALYVEVEFDLPILEFDAELLELSLLKEKIPNTFDRCIRCGGILISEVDAKILENFWANYLRKIAKTYVGNAGTRTV